MKHILLLICVAVSISGFGCKKPVHQEQVSIGVSPKEMQVLLQDNSVQLIDVRTPKEYNEGHIGNAKNIDFLASTFSTSINTLDKQKPVLIYCRSGKRSGDSVDKFLKLGFTKIYNLEGGILKWKSEGLETNK